MKKQINLLLTTALLSSAIAYSQEVSLKFNPADGSNYAGHNTTTTKVTMEVMGQEMDINMDYNVDIDYHIQDESPNKITTFTYKSMKVQSGAMGQNITLDSNDPDTSKAETKPLRAIVGSTIKTTISPDGSIVKVEGVDELAKKAGSSSPQTEELLKRFLSEDAIKSMMEQSFKIYPSKAVKPGDTWSSTFEIATPYKMKIENTYTLKSVANGKSNIDVTGKVATDGKQSMESNGVQLELELGGTLTGSYVVDNATGMPDSTSITQNLSGSANAMGQELPMKVVSDSKATFTKQ